ncbi:uncharacterized protein LOC135846757 [Planococcus citri]|uniref:uncharacterized protein LOC135846757 n=1 Tax=Planococcus citri TaxID=170843 RepID=UPI0031F749B7
MKKSLISLFLLICIQVMVYEALGAVLKEEPSLQKWNSFKTHFGKKYKTEQEDKQRMKIYLDNMNEISQHNKVFKKGEETYELEINQFSDLTSKEFSQLYPCKVETNVTASKDFFANETFVGAAAAPKEKDWVKEGKVTSIKDQSQCGSCWAFGTIGAIESHFAIATGKLQDLSPQNLLDCTGGINSCNGGYMNQAYDYVIRNKGVATEKSYPYRGRKGHCQYNSNSRGASIKGYKYASSNEEAIKQVVGTIGPVTIGINCGDLLQHYRSGIFKPRNRGSRAGHALVIVGYGSESGTDYWLVKNSWSTTWGMKGYGKIVRNQNACGISRSVLYPIGVVAIMNMMQSSIYLCVLICVQILVHGAIQNDEEYKLQKWNSFKAQHSKQYETMEEEERRMKIYLDNEKKIAEHNERFEKGEETYEMGINKFSDLTDQEFAALYLTKIAINRNISKDFHILESSEKDAPDKKNWVKEGKVSSVKNQGQCRSCWAFATAATIESHVAIQKNSVDFTDLSPQNLVDCVKKSYGCWGGHLEYAFEYVQQNEGIATEISYPYEDEQGACRYDSNYRGATINAYKWGYPNNSDVIKLAVGTIGPVAGSLNSTTLRHYNKGIIFSKDSENSEGPHCKNEIGTADHAIVIVGYSYDKKSKLDYWLVKNSWGPEWGDKGYFRIARNVNMCGIENFMIYPTGVKGI